MDVDETCITEQALNSAIALLMRKLTQMLQRRRRETENINASLYIQHAREARWLQI